MSNRRRDEENEKARRVVYLLGLACLIQLFVSLQASRRVTGALLDRRDRESRALERRIREEAAAPVAPGATVP